jgi:hypothetical protein
MSTDCKASLSAIAWFQEVLLRQLRSPMVKVLSICMHKLLMRRQAPVRLTGVLTAGSLKARFSLKAIAFTMIVGIIGSQFKR